MFRSLLTRFLKLKCSKLVYPSIPDQIESQLLPRIPTHSESWIPCAFSLSEVFTISPSILFKLFKCFKISILPSDLFPLTSSYIGFPTKSTSFKPVKEFCASNVIGRIIQIFIEHDINKEE